MERTRLSGREYSAIATWFALGVLSKEAGHVLAARAKQAAPGTYRDLRMLPKKLESVLDALIRTIDKKKVDQIMQDLEHVHMYVRVEAPGIRTIQNVQWSYLKTDTLNDLLNYMLGQECALCDKTPAEARHCRFRALIEDALPHDVGVMDDEHCKYSDLSLGIQEVKG